MRKSVVSHNNNFVTRWPTLIGEKFQQIEKSLENWVVEAGRKLDLMMYDFNNFLTFWCLFCIDVCLYFLLAKPKAASFCITVDLQIILHFVFWIHFVCLQPVFNYPTQSFNCCRRQTKITLLYTRYWMRIRPNSYWNLMLMISKSEFF